MKRVKGLWNLIRVALIVFCGWRLILVAIDVQFNERLLSNARPAEGIDVSAVEGVQANLHEHAGSVPYYIILTVICLDAIRDNQQRRKG